MNKKLVDLSKCGGSWVQQNAKVLSYPFFGVKHQMSYPFNVVKENGGR